MRERERALQEDNSSYELVDPAVGLQPTKKVVAKYIYPDGTGVTDWYGFGKAFG
jgi:hypothetical protein